MMTIMLLSTDVSFSFSFNRILQISLFSIACFETHRRNSLLRTVYYDPSRPPATTMQPGMGCPTCNPGMSHQTLTMGQHNKPVSPSHNNLLPNTIPVPHPVSAPLPVQRPEMPAVTRPPPHMDARFSSAPVQHELSTGNTPRYEMYVQNAGTDNRHELALE